MLINPICHQGWFTTQTGEFLSLWLKALLTNPIWWVSTIRLWETWRNDGICHKGGKCDSLTNSYKACLPTHSDIRVGYEHREESFSPFSRELWYLWVVRDLKKFLHAQNESGESNHLINGNKKGMLTNPIWWVSTIRLWEIWSNVDICHKGGRKSDNLANGNKVLVSATQSDIRLFYNTGRRVPVPLAERYGDLSSLWSFLIKFDITDTLALKIAFCQYETGPLERNSFGKLPHLGYWQTDRRHFLWKSQKSFCIQNPFILYLT